jgi:hypothetical protein
MTGSIIVVFTKSKVKWLNFLKRFGHVYLYVQYKEQWIRIDGNFDRTNLSIFSNSFVMKDILKKKNVTITYVRNKRKPYLPMLNGCVSFAKSVIGIYKPFIITPYQLFKYLTKVNKCNKDYTIH